MNRHFDPINLGTTAVAISTRLMLRCIMQYVENHRAHWSEYAENRARN